MTFVAAYFFDLNFQVGYVFSIPLLLTKKRPLGCLGLPDFAVFAKRIATRYRLLIHLVNNATKHPKQAMVLRYFVR